MDVVVFVVVFVVVVFFFCLFVCFVFCCCFFVVVVCLFFCFFAIFRYIRILHFAVEKRWMLDIVFSNVKGCSSQIMIVCFIVLDKWLCTLFKIIEKSMLL